MALLTERYADKILGQLSCYDRIVIQGTLPGFCYADGMTAYLYANNIRIFDYPRFAEPLRNELRDNAEKIARDNGLQIYFNGHGWLASKLRKRNIDYHLIDNVFTSIDNFPKAQKIADQLKVDMIHKALDRFADQYCPAIAKFNLRYHWSIMQAEYATDIVFKRQQDLQAIYDQLTRTAIHLDRSGSYAGDVCCFVG